MLSLKMIQKYILINEKKIKEFNNFDIVLCYTTFGNNLAKYKTAISGIYKPGITGFIDVWENINNYIKAVYRWNGGEEWSPILKYDGGMIKFWVWKDFKTWDKAQRGIATTAAIGLRAFGSWEPLIW
uniref:Uncharacterized protein n=2 Tax=Spiroplasma citri TaxID=2133 RepID=Q14K96_SPICI|nr:hypothetical protein SPICINP18_004 [Spiroplasma citri]